MALSKSSSRRAVARRQGGGRVRRLHAWPTPSRRGGCSQSSRTSLLLRVMAADCDGTLGGHGMAIDKTADLCYIEALRGASC
jgi:hypothetical protein